MALADSDIVTAVNGAGFPDAATLQDGFTVLLAFAQALEAAAKAANTTPPTTVAQLAGAFAQRASLSVQIQALQAQLASINAGQVTATANAETARQNIQGQISTLTAQIAAV